MSYNINARFQLQTFHIRAFANTTLHDVKREFLRQSNIKVDIDNLKSWTEGGTPLVNDNYTMMDYNLVHNDTVLYLDMEYPIKVETLYTKYYS